MMDAQLVREHFPALASGALHFDNPAGTQISREALERIRECLVKTNSNHGAAFRTSRASDALVAETRAAMADLLGARSPAEIVFGQNMTSLTLHISRSIAQELSEGDEIVCTRLDHDANVAPWLLIARDRGCAVRWVDFDPADCSWSLAELESKITGRTRLVAVAWASNATGTVNPVVEAVRLAHEAGALCFVDAVHYVPHSPIDVAADGCDLLACSAYKFFGPHTGVLYGRGELLERLSPYKVRPARDEPPEKWETGTQSFESIAGVLGAVEYLEWVGATFGGAAGGGGRREAAAAGGRRARLQAAMRAIRECEKSHSRSLLAGLLSVPGLRIYGITNPAEINRRVPTFAFTIDGLAPRRICEELDRRGIYAWDGHFYALEVTARLGLEGRGGLVRVGTVHYNTPAEIERLVSALAEIAEAAGR
jgi:cysteine desulfurase family protein (TIGR01976 family)